MNVLSLKEFELP